MEVTLPRLLAFALALSALAAGQAAALDDPAEVLRRLDEHYRQVRSLKAGFVQQEKVATIGRLRESRGTLYLKRPGRMRWEYHEPQKQSIVAEGETLWIHRPAEKTAYRLTLAREEVSRTPLALLFQSGRGLGDFFAAASVSDAGGGLVRLELKPLSASPEIASAAVTLRSSDGSLAGTSIRDAFGNRTEVRLEGAEENAAIDDGLFSFKPPAGTRVLSGGERTRGKP